MDSPNNIDNHPPPWSAFMAEAVSGAVFVVVVLMGFGLLQGRPADSPPAQVTLSPSTPPTENLSNPQETKANDTPSPSRPIDHEDRLFSLLERLNAQMEHLSKPSSQEDYVAAMDRLGQQMVKATEAMVSVQSRGLQEQALNRDVLLGLKEQVENLEGLIVGPESIPEPRPRAIASLPPLFPTSAFATSPTESREHFFSRLRASLTRSQLRIFIDPSHSSVTLPPILDFDRGSPLPGTRQRRALTALAQGLAQILPCHVAHPPENLKCGDQPGAVRLDAIRIHGQAAFAHPGEPRFFFNWKLATARAYHALKTMLSAQPELLSMKNSRGQTLFQVEGTVAGNKEDDMGQRLGLHFRFEPPDFEPDGPSRRRFSSQPEISNRPQAIDRIEQPGYPQ